MPLVLLLWLMVAGFLGMLLGPSHILNKPENPKPQTLNPRPETLNTQQKRGSVVDPALNPRRRSKEA